MTQKTATPPLRYRVKIIMAAMSEKERLQVKREVMKITKISDSSYSRYINLREGDSPDMPAFVLRAFAQALSTTMEKLYNCNS